MDDSEAIAALKRALKTLDLDTLHKLQRWWTRSAHVNASAALGVGIVSAVDERPRTDLRTGEPKV